MDSNSQQTIQDSSLKLKFLKPNPEKCVDRVPTLSKVDGLENVELEILNRWCSKFWKKIYGSGFILDENLTKDFTNYLELNSTIAIDLDKADSYLSVQKLLYNGLRLELENLSERSNNQVGSNGTENSANSVVTKNGSDTSVSQCKLFHRYYYSCRENAVALNNLVVLSNVIWSLKKYKRDEFALTCLIDILLQSYMVALDSFISLGGVEVIRENFEFLALNGRLKQSSNYLLKCMELLDKLDINFRILQTSKIGIPVNCIALGRAPPRLSKADYDCSNDKVKLKATNLIKKWKAIRDASVPQKEQEHKQKKPVQVLEKQSSTESTGPIEHEGSFVLDIINTMVEQKEKEKKRKLQIKNSHLPSKYKMKSGEVTDNGDRSVVSGKADKVVDKVQNDKDNTELSSCVNSNKLASLMNFFKEYSNNSGNSDNPSASSDNANGHSSQDHSTNITTQISKPISDTLGTTVSDKYGDLEDKRSMIPPPPPPPFNKAKHNTSAGMSFDDQKGAKVSRFTGYPMVGKILPPGAVPPPPPKQPKHSQKHSSYNVRQYTSSNTSYQMYNPSNSDYNTSNSDYNSLNSEYKSVHFESQNKRFSTHKGNYAPEVLGSDVSIAYESSFDRTETPSARETIDRKLDFYRTSENNTSNDQQITPPWK
ncbi:uncharacterized protein TA20935 [Theileria annulata]|uniref:TFIIS N-terminal domain-containing protein n=1 Tax=Theileria annulata TaxID=5874 RepID=Q4UGW8_THEAN|nr:uncharacterized protein TA20935 [Theileria annulata]CAI73671.1 hypothetical protein TA20935 [Theileria annulata]|eukprot:XP_954348.1 hypothetical protein TA20935 [Theileria annulata]